MLILSPCLENTIVSVNFKNIFGVLEWTEDLCKRKHLQFTQRLVTLFIKSLSLLFSAIIHHSVFHQVSPAFSSLIHSSDLSWPVCAVTLPLYICLCIYGYSSSAALLFPPIRIAPASFFFLFKVFSVIMFHQSFSLQSLLCSVLTYAFGPRCWTLSQTVLTHLKPCCSFHLFLFFFLFSFSTV